MADNRLALSWRHPSCRVFRVFPGDGKNLNPPIPINQQSGVSMSLFNKMLAVTCGFLAFVAVSAVAVAADKGTPTRAEAAQLAPVVSSWSGCGIQIHGGHAIGELNGGGPIGLSSTGLLAGASVLCDLQIGTSVVVGAFGGAEKAFGDFDTLGISHQWDVGMRAGFLIHPSVLLYGHAAFTRASVTSLGDIDGWKWGPGMEVKLPASAWSFDLRYQLSDMDIGAFAPGVDAEVRTVRFGLTYKLGGSGAQVGKIFE